jgi:hypothetical protein
MRVIMKKELWKKPELIVLVRNQPEEVVLNGCKGGGLTTSFLSHKDGCHSDAPTCTSQCSDLFSS